MAGPSSGIVNGFKNENGKRERIDQEDDQEFMPLSKRINNIHLSPERLVNGNHHIPSHPGVNGVAAVGYPNGSSSNYHVSNYGDTTGQLSDYAHEASQFHQRLVQGGLRNTPIQYGTNGVLPLISDLATNSSSSGVHPHQVLHAHLGHNSTLQSLEIPGVIPCHNGSGDQSSIIEYRPTLNESANPHYYESNRALFHLYLERQLRNNQSPHPNVLNRTLNHLDSCNNTL